MTRVIKKRSVPAALEYSFAERSITPDFAFNVGDFLKASVGFSPYMRLHESLNKESDGNYPPYNLIQKDEKTFTMVLAVAGFIKDELTITEQNNVLEIKGEQLETSDEGIVFLHKGIAARKFVKKVQLDKHVKVYSADLVDGLLTICFLRETPEEEKVKKIEIQ